MSERTVRFFEVLDEDGRQIPDLDWDGVLDDVAAIPTSDAYVQVARKELLGSAYRSPTSGPRGSDMLILDRITREARIRIENNRGYRPLRLGAGDTIAEPTHFGLFPRNVVGVMRAGVAAPSAASFRDFINTLGILDGMISVKPLADINAIRAFGRVERLTKLDIEMDAFAATRALGATSLLGEVFDNFRTRLGGVTVQVVVKIDKADAEAGEVALDEVRGLVLGSPDNGLRGVNRAEIGFRRIEDGRADSFDFISESVAQAVDIDVDGDGAGATDLSASQGMAQAYDSLYEDIQSALNGTPAVGPDQ